LDKKYYISRALILFSSFFLLLQYTEAQNSFDSLKIKQPKHYFKTVIVIDGYRKPTQAIKDTIDFLSPRLKTYGVKQLIFSLNTPIATIESPGKDSGVTKNMHVLLTANYMSLKPIFDGISQHNLVKAGIGIRMIFNSGKKGIWFIDASPFVTRDVTYTSKPYYRLASTIVYSRNENDYFNWRLGVTKSFLWGNRLYLPFFGLRFGRLDKAHVSIQFPRCININLPINHKVSMSIYTKPQGGMFNFSNVDSLYYLGNASTFHFTRYEINTGFRADVRVNSWFNFYVATGFSTKNNITFYSDKANKTQKLNYSKFFYNQTLEPTLFFNTGLVFKFGRTKSYYNNKNIYDAIDLNNTIDGGDNNTSNGNTQIPISPKNKKPDLNLKSIQDLIDYNDF